MSEIHRYTLVTKNNFNSDQRQLFDLVRAAGFTLHPQLFKVMMELLSLHVPPHALVSLLKDVSGCVQGDHHNNNDSHMNNGTGIPE